MRRLFFRILGIWFLAGAIFVAVVDGAKSIAASELVLTPLSGTLAILSGPGAPGDPAAPLFAAPWPLDAALAFLTSAPSAAVLAALGLLCLIAGRRPRPHVLSREYAT
jgi:hypothetical protein